MLRPGPSPIVIIDYCTSLLFVVRPEPRDSGPRWDFTLLRGTYVVTPWCRHREY